MAKKINTKVLIVGIVVLVGIIFVAGAGLFALSWKNNPKRRVGQAKALLTILEKQELDLESEEQMENYKKAVGYYSAAFAKSKKVEDQVEYMKKAIAVLEKIQEWDSVAQCWKQIVTIDFNNWQAREEIINYLKTRSESGEVWIWSKVETEVDSYIEARQEADLEVNPKYTYLKGKSLFHSAIAGTTDDPKSTIAQAINFMEAAISESDNPPVDYYDYLIKCILQKAKMQEESGVLGASEKAKQEAGSLLDEYLTNNPDNAKAESLKVAINLGGSREQMLLAEPEFLKLLEKYPDSAVVHADVANHYNRTGQKKKALTFMEKAADLDPEKIEYIINIIALSYDNFNISGDYSYIENATNFAQRALVHPDTQDTKSITLAMNKSRRLTVNTLLAQIYIELAIDPQYKGEKQQNLEQAEKSIHEIKQAIASEESAAVLKWDGLYQFASGNRDQGLDLMYKAYEKNKAGNKIDSFLSYNLASSFLGTNEQGLILEFLTSALSDNNFLMTRPKVLSYYISVLLKVSPAGSINAIETYETLFGPSKESRTLKFKAFLATNQIEKAKDLLGEFDESDPNRTLGEITIIAQNINRDKVTLMQLQNKAASGDSSVLVTAANLESSIQKQLSKKNNLVSELINTSPEIISTNTLRDYYSYCINQQKFEEAKNAINKLAGMRPDDLNIKVLLKMSLEPDPNKIDDDRKMLLTKEAINEIVDNSVRLEKLGQFYISSGKLEEAKKAYENLLDIEGENYVAIVTLFDIANQAGNLEKMNSLAQLAKEKNIDGYNGLTFEARVDSYDKNYESALEKLSKCIEEKPLRSSPYYLRSQVLANLKKYDSAVEDAITTMKYNPFNPEFSRNYALILYQRNLELGDSLKAEQRVQARNAIQNALAMNANSSQLQAIYVDVIGQNEPEKAIAILQNLQKQDASLKNLTQIAMLSLKVATNDTVYMREDLRKSFFEIAESSIKSAMQMDPENLEVTKLYARLMQETGRKEDATKLLESNKALLWKFNIQNGEYGKAKEILDELYFQDSNNREILAGLLLIAEKTRNVEDVQKYSSELIKNDSENLENNLAQIRSYIEVNLLDEAKSKIDSLLERGVTDPRLYLLNAVIYTKYSQLDEALETTNSALANDPENAQGWKIRGNINSLLGNFEQAIEDFKKSKAIKDTPEVRISLAKAYVQTGQKNNAVAELGTAIENPQAPILAWLLLEDIHLRSNNQLEIDNFYEKAIEKFKNSPAWYNKYADYFFKKDNFSSAASFYLEGWNLNERGNMESFTGYLNSLIKSEEYGVAVSFASRHIDDNYSIPALLFIAKAKYESGDEDAANDFLSKTIKRAGNHHNALGNTAIFIADEINLQVAVDLFSNAYELNKSSSSLNYCMFLLSVKQENYDKALKHIESAAKLAENDQIKNFLLSKKLETLQEVYSKTKSEKYLNTVMDEYQKSIERNPNNPNVLNNLAFMLAKKEIQLDEALAYIEKAMSLAPNNPGVMDTYGYILIKTGDAQKALTIFNRAKQLFERNAANAPAEFYYHLGIANEMLDNKEAALNAYRNAIEIDDQTLTNDDLEKIKTSINKLEI